MQPTPLTKPKSQDEPPPDPRANINRAAFEWTRLAEAWMRDDSNPHRIFLLGIHCGNIKLRRYVSTLELFYRKYIYIY